MRRTCIAGRGASLVHISLVVAARSHGEKRNSVEYRRAPRTRQSTLKLSLTQGRNQQATKQRGPFAAGAPVTSEALENKEDKERRGECGIRERETNKAGRKVGIGYRMVPLYEGTHRLDAVCNAAETNGWRAVSLVAWACPTAARYSALSDETAWWIGGGLNCQLLFAACA